MWSYRNAHQAMQGRTALSYAMRDVRAWIGIAGFDIRLFYRM